MTYSHIRARSEKTLRAFLVAVNKLVMKMFCEQNILLHLLMYPGFRINDRKLTWSNIPFID